MKDNNYIKKALLILGCTLLLVSYVISVNLAFKSRNVRIDPEDTVRFLESVIPDRTAGIKEERSNNEMPALSYEGQDYSAILSLPGLSLTLPVRSSWDRSLVRKVPCRFTGDPYEGTLVVGGVDQEGQFDFVSGIENGDVITVTDMKGCVFTYTVSAVRHANNSEAKTLIDENYDFTLFTKDRKTGEWLLVRCRMK